MHDNVVGLYAASTFALINRRRHEVGMYNISKNIKKKLNVLMNFNHLAIMKNTIKYCTSVLVYRGSNAELMTNNLLLVRREVAIIYSRRYKNVCTIVFALRTLCFWKNKN